MTAPLSWFVLLHTPGPALPAGQVVFDHPGIGQHFEFLERRAADGTLIAAGPLGDADSNGMTVLAVPSLAEAERLATKDDRSVVEGILAVRVRPWTVVMAPITDR